jgi:UDP:flavonoid glycosyltransferase YjiC (YdhE family)
MIPDFPPPYTIATKNLNIPKAYHKNLQFIGPILPESPADLPDKMELRKQLGLDPDKPVVFAPISGPAKERAYFTGILRQIFNKFPDDLQVVMSLGYPNSSVAPVKHGNLFVYNWLPNRFEYLKACDLEVSRGGHGTMSQAMCYGKPLILVPTPSHTEQYNNAKKALDLGVGELIEQENLTKTSLLAAVNKILDKNAYQQTCDQLQSSFLSCDGLKTAIQIILDAAKRG